MEAGMTPDASRIRVLQIVDRLDEGGAERIVVDILKNLDRSRFDPFVCVTREPGRFAEEVQATGVSLLCLDRGHRFDLGGFARLVQHIRALRPHIVHTHKVGSNTLGRLAALVAGAPVIIAHEHTLPERSLTQRFADRLLAHLTTQVLTCDRALRTALIAAERLSARKVGVIHNGVDLQRLASIPMGFNGQSSYSLRRQLGLPTGPLVGTFARLAPQKDISNLLAAVPFVLERVADAHFIIAGDGPLREELQADVLNRGLANRVLFLGFRADIPALLEAIDLFVLSSTWEGLPVTVLEAMARGKPVVSTNVGGVADAVIPGATGLLVPSRNPTELGKAIVGLLSDPAARCRMGLLGRRRVAEEFSIQAMVSRIEALYIRELSDECGVRNAEFRTFRTPHSSLRTDQESGL
jgi:glycosyltransferase involved in cell wall biosynthesis